MFMENKRDSAAVLNGRAVVGACVAGLGWSSLLPIVCVCWYDDVGTENCL
jgi:hypothetical protein